MKRFQPFPAEILDCQRVEFSDDGHSDDLRSMGVPEEIVQREFSRMKAAHDAQEDIRIASAVAKVERIRTVGVDHKRIGATWYTTNRG